MLLVALTFGGQCLQFIAEEVDVLIETIYHADVITVFEIVQGGFVRNVVGAAINTLHHLGPLHVTLSTGCNRIVDVHGRRWLWRDRYARPQKEGRAQKECTGLHHGVGLSRLP